VPIRIPLSCMISGHKRDRDRVWWDGVDWRSNCITCDKPMIRYRHNWRLFEPSDESADRKTKHVAD
jgi:hypothetical protein